MGEPIKAAFLTLGCKVNQYETDAMRELLEEARKGKYDGFLLEGMACPGGCVGGAGTMQGPTKAKGQIVVAKKKSLKKNALESSYKDRLDLLAERGKLR